MSWRDSYQIIVASVWDYDPFHVYLHRVLYVGMLWIVNCEKWREVMLVFQKTLLLEGAHTFMKLRDDAGVVWIKCCTEEM
jgi:hypothetical protein